MPTKLIVTHREAIQSKYRDGDGWPSIERMIQKLIAADVTRGITTTLVYLDDVSMGGARALRGDARSFKAAIDHVATREPKPDYIVILGGPDIVPHQTVVNPVGDNDPDRHVPSDLPYACDAPWSDHADDFIGPSRVVGRIPDQPDSLDAEHLIRLLDHAAQWKPRTQVSNDYHSVTASVWIGCATITLNKVFGNANALRISPDDGPNWSRAEMAPQWHFIVCHGSHAKPEFYGQKGRDYPVSHLSEKVIQHTNVGIVVAAECCYGAELYSKRLADVQGTCLSYLRSGALCFAGSTNVAYGGSDNVSGCDYLLRYFLEHARRGASLGRALLEARLEFIRGVDALSPVDLKTLAQFLLLGDPSLRAVATTPFETLTHSKTVIQAHTARRDALAAQADAARATPRAETQSAAYTPDDVRARLESEARAAGFVGAGSPRSHDVRVPGQFTSAGAGGASGIRFHVMAAHPPGESPLPRGVDQESGPTPVMGSMLLVAREENGVITKVDRLYARSGAAGGEQVFEGRVVRRLIGQGSRSEHDAVMLEVGEEALVLRRRDGNAFSDPVLDGLVGKRIRATGDHSGYTLIMREWTVIA